MKSGDEEDPTSSNTAPHSPLLAHEEEVGMGMGDGRRHERRGSRSSFFHPASCTTSTTSSSSSQVRASLPPGLMYAAVYGAFGCIQPFLPVQLEKEKGLTPAHLGQLASACALASFFASSAASVVADGTRSHRDFLRGSCLLAAFFAPFLPVLPATPLLPCLLVLLLVCPFPPGGGGGGGGGDGDGDDCGRGQNVVWCPIVPLVDGAVMEDLGMSNKKHEYGRHRMWGSIGFGGSLSRRGGGGGGGGGGDEDYA